MTEIQKYDQELEAVRQQIITGKPVNNQRAFEMARIDRLAADWLSTVTSFNYDLRQGGIRLIARAREIAKNDPIGRKYLRMVRRNIVGPNGFTLRNKAFDFVNGKKQFDKTANQIIQDGFWDWGKKKFCTVNKNLTFRNLCGLLVESIFMDGEIFIREYRGGFNKYGYTQQLIEAEHVDFTLNKSLGNGNIILMGIEYASYPGEPVAYHFRKRKPEHELYYSSATSKDYERVEADKVIHLFIKEVPNQVRGITQYCPSALRMKMLYGWIEAGLVNARATASTVFAYEHQSESNPEFKNLNASSKDAQGNTIQDVAPGETLEVPKGLKLAVLDPKFPHEQHGAYVKSIGKDIASGLDVSFHTLFSDYEGVNYTSSRSALLDERDGWQEHQASFCEDYCDTTFARWLEMALLAGALKFQTGSTLPVGKFEKFNQPEWTGRTWKWVDPKNEAEAIILSLKNKIRTPQDVYAEMGYEMEEVLEQWKEAREKFAEYGFDIEKTFSESKAAPAQKENENESEGKVPVKTNGNGKHLIKELF